MQEASEKAVLGDFDDAQFTYEGVSTRFYRKDGKPFLHLELWAGRRNLMHDRLRFRL
jgi:hypothetical protein